MRSNVALILLVGRFLGTRVGCKFVDINEVVNKQIKQGFRG